MPLQRHPLSAAFPSMSAEEQDALTADVEQHGQRDPITIFDGQVLDGWHRYQACQMIGITCLEKVLDDGIDPVAFVISMNKHRRHMEKGQMAVAVVSCNEWRKVGRPSNNPATVAELTTKELATQAGTGTRTIERAKVAVEAGLADKVRDGEMSLEKAAEIAKPKAPPAPLPPVAKPEEPKPETITITKHEYEELHAVIEEYKTESEATAAVFDADDKVSEAVDEIRKLTAKVALLETQKTGLQNQANELKRSSVSKDRQIAKLTKELDGYKLAAVGL